MIPTVWYSGKGVIVGRRDRSVVAKGWGRRRGPIPKRQRISESDEKVMCLYRGDGDLAFAHVKIHKAIHIKSQIHSM